ncbi:DNA internalization-related competence protein ComEC/Rec2 [Rhizobacter sp. SG703]|uniref:DNA internalization-related competence protein ComEC/Rec2 n=1 Tax=Rhizobacter sp. SG703 TaxID=2587140 RepID=UPI001444EAB8|nr:DNA internalization-related competence protein ComEC/Rec2 [Rhizobacter sp. SG703]NKI93669.1 competence protein ComEC [Rhizobacter sp. SG703]
MGGQGGLYLAGTTAAWLLGCAWQIHQATVRPAWVAVGLLAAAVGTLLLVGHRRRLVALAVLAAFVAGFAASDGRAGLRLAAQLPTALEGQDLQLTGVVASLPDHTPSGLQFRFEVDEARWRGEPVAVPPLVSLGWYKGWHDDGPLSGPQAELRAGQAWRFTARLRQPHGSLNPGGFDVELMMFEQGVRATGYVLDGHAELLDPAAAHPIERLRQRVRDRLYAQVDDPQAAGVLAALAVGDQSAIERADWQLFRSTGIAHLVSISGLHITMFAWLAARLAGALWRRSVRAMLWLPAPLAARWIGLAAAAGYALFAGWGVPAQRTVWMLAVVTLLQAGARRWPWPLVLLAAAVVVTAFDPWALLQPGFWLSFMAVGLLMASEPSHGLPARGETPGRLAAVSRSLRAGLRTQAIATIGLAPLTLVFFQQISLVGFAANLVAIPLVTLVITPLALLGAAWPWLWTLGAWVEQQLVALLMLLAQAPWAVWSVPAAPWWAAAAGLLSAVLLVLPLPWRLRLLAVPLALPLLLPPRELPPAGRFELLALDVGQGTAVLVRTQRHLLVYDAGPQYSRDADAGQRVLLPLLRSRGEDRIDRLVLSHRDADHTGGAAAVIAGLPVGELDSSLEDGHPLLGSGVPTTRCVAGQWWDWDGVHFQMLHPFADDYGRARKPNAVSCVLRVSAGGRSALLTGDIEREQEGALVERSRDALRSDLLLVAHHGSRTSSSADFLDAVQPQVALIQAGYRNRFGHPVPEVLARLHERDVLVAATTSCGAWRWRSDQPPAAGVCERDRARRYWHHRIEAP